MAEPTRMRPYYEAVCLRAASDAFALARRKGVEAGWVVTVIAVIATSVLDGGVNVVHAILAAVIALAGFVVLVFVANLIRAPVLLANEAANTAGLRAKDAASIADNDRRALKAEIIDMQGKVTRLRTELDRITSLPVPDNHRSVLCDFAARVRQEFDHPHPAFVRPPSDEDSLLRSSVSAHFPALAVVVDTYLSAEERLQDAERSLMERIQRECGPRGIGDPPYLLDQVYGSLWPGLHALAKRWPFDPAAWFEWRRLWTPDQPGADVGSVMLLRRQSDKPLAQMAAASSDDAANLVAELTSRVEALFGDAQAWDEFAAIRDAYSVLMALLPESRAVARLAAEREEIRMTKDCPICADQLDQR